MQYTQLSRRSAGGKIDWEKQYLTFIPVEDAVFSWEQTAVSGHLEYSINGGQTWVTIANGESTPTVAAGSKVIWRGDLVPSTVLGRRGIGIFSASGLYDAMGNTMSLLYGDNYIGQTTLVGTYTFCNLWQEDTHIYRVDRMVLPAMSMSKSCYNLMFNGCTNLVTAPELPATTLEYYCYDKMFRNCTSLTTAPALPETTLATSCYNSMFQGCTSLTSAPELPATTLSPTCYQDMFSGCTSLVTAPELPATTLKQSCYQGMFQGCRSLTSAPELPATTLASRCYNGMFRGCTGLTTAPTLPATTLAEYCYTNMFYGCTGLTTSPELPATTLTSYCYQEMFRSCTSLSYIKCLATDISAVGCTTNWLRNVASTGTFVKAAGMEDWTTGTSGIPSGWTVVDDNS